jgi:CheY-like chemotaxis protein
MPIIAITASAFDFDVARAMKAGCDAHLSKPIKGNDLLRVLDDQLAASAADSNRAAFEKLIVDERDQTPTCRSSRPALIL